VHWQWHDGAWRAQELPGHTHDFLRVVFIADTHGCHGMLDRYFQRHPEALHADVLCICGDAFEHEGVTEEEAGPSILTKMGFNRNFADWLQRLPHRYKICTSGNHESCFMESEAAALRGVLQPHAGAAARAYLTGRGGPCLLLQDEAAVIRLAGGGELKLYGTPWTSGA